MDRRSFLERAGAAVLGPSLWPDTSYAELSDQLNVTLTLDGRDYVYAMNKGVDLGDFVAPRFTQRCVRVDHPESSLSVFFRPDRTSERIEIVVELGRMWGEANQQARHLNAYRAVIRNGARELATLKVPYHWWFSRWRWQSSPRPIIRTPQQLLDAKLIPPYRPAAATHAAPARQSKPPVYNHPMDTGGLQTGVGAAGERLELGPITEYQGDYIITGRSESLAALRAQAEAAGSMPMHVRDEKTNAPVDFFQYPELDWYYMPAGTPWIKGPQTIRDSDGNVTCEWILDSAHDPALNYIPYLLTDDPYHLEELQFQGNQVLGWTAYHRAVNKLQIVYPSETRSFAWSMRTMFQLATVTPTKTPIWLKPRSYWKHIVDDNLTWFTAHYVKNPSPVTAIFNSATRIDNLASWQEDFVAFCLGWGVLLGFEDWRPAFRWKLGSTLARSNGKSGWPRQWRVPYSLSLAKVEPLDMLYAEKSPPDTWYESWKEVWDDFRANPENEVKLPFPDSTSWAQHNSPDFILYTRGALALATHLGVDEAHEPYAFVTGMTDRMEYMTYKWAVQGI